MNLKGYLCDIGCTKGSNNSIFLLILNIFSKFSYASNRGMTTNEDRRTKVLKIANESLFKQAAEHVERAVSFLQHGSAKSMDVNLRTSHRGMTADKDRKTKALKMAAQASERLKNPVLIFLDMQAKVDPFSKVKGAHP